MRKILFWTVFVAAAIVIQTSKQTVDDISGGTSKTTQFTQYSAYKYLWSVLWIVLWSVLWSVLWILFAYTLWAFINSKICGRRDHCGGAEINISSQTDNIMLTLLASANGTAGADGWSKTCNVLDKFCRHMWASFGMSLFACCLFVWIIVISASSIRTA
ncbi:hypothetical protein MKW94_019831 [Papaver nudicaule]|uniref:CASP-like protein n=1 Tax=Papaver nudicaule TaxID=74823 RepID=A0AA41SBI3_PAPNU|nr:hypothetical protein [Papaver nudicaule]